MKNKLKYLQQVVRQIKRNSDQKLESYPSKNYSNGNSDSKSQFFRWLKTVNGNMELLSLKSQQGLKYNEQII